jgi:sulfoxide reductase heme-binding subunit YedZ
MLVYLLLWLAIVTGLGLTTTLLDRWGGRGVIYSVHRFATGLAYGFLWLHLLSLAADPTVQFGPRALFAPFAAPWREPWTGLGVLAGWLTMVIGASFGVRRLIGYRAWRALHWLAFPQYWLALLHGLGAGSDTNAAWARALYLVTGMVVVCLISYRVLRAGTRWRAPRVTTLRPFDRFAPAPSRRPDRV